MKSKGKRLHAIEKRGEIAITTRPIKVALDFPICKNSQIDFVERKEKIYFTGFEN